MKKYISILFILLTLTLTGCSDNVDEMRRDALQAEIAQLEAERDALKAEVIDTKIENGTEKYVITFKIKQTHFTLDISQHLKDSMNDISIEIPVDKEYYDSVEVGDVIDDSFRMGSFIWKGSFGNWNVSIENKEIR